MKLRYLVFGTLLGLSLILVASAGAVLSNPPTIDSGPSGTVATNDATFTFSSSEPGVTGFECSLDGGSFVACDSGSETYSNLLDGDHTFDVHATDADPSSGPNATRNWTINTPPPPDTNPPNTTIDSHPPASTASTTADFNYSSDEPNSTFECKLDSGSFIGCQSSGKTYTGLSEGGHNFQVQATDSAGNTDPSPDQYSWTVLDSTPPNTTITSGPAALTNSASATFHYSSTESGSSFECKLDAGSFASCGSSGKSYSGLADGLHTFSVQATDSSGNTDASPDVAQWTVDTKAPLTNLTRDVSNPTNATAVRFDFVSNEGGTFKCELDGGNFSTCTSPKLYTGLSEASHTFQVQATDDAGNVGNPASSTWTIDLTPGTSMRNVTARAGDGVVVLRYAFPPGADINKVVIMRTLPGTRFPLRRKRAWAWRFRDTTVRNGRCYTYDLRSLDTALNESLPVTVRACPRDPLIFPRDGAFVSRWRPPLFRWVGVAGAVRYNMQLWRRGAGLRRFKVLSVFPFRPQYQLRRTWWYRHHRQRLLRGATYDWYVYPWYGARYGRLVGQNWFRAR